MLKVSEQCEDRFRAVKGPASFVEEMSIVFLDRVLIAGVFCTTCVLTILANPLFSSEAGNHDPLSVQVLRKGSLLVASPSLKDPHFRETVVLVCHDEAGRTLGVIINRPTELSLSEVFPDIAGLQDLSDTLFEGGPVQQNVLIMLFRSKTGSDHTKTVIDGVYWGGDRKKLASMVPGSDPQERFRVFAGYAGWSQRQLEAELAGGFWTSVPADVSHIFDSDPATLWEELVHQSTNPLNFVSFPTSKVY